MLGWDKLFSWFSFYVDSGDPNLKFESLNENPKSNFKIWSNEESCFEGEWSNWHTFSSLFIPNCKNFTNFDISVDNKFWQTKLPSNTFQTNQNFPIGEQDINQFEQKVQPGWETALHEAAKKVINMGDSA